jgi:lysyl-tRNA synthetase class 2
VSTSRNAVPHTAARSGRSVPPYRVASEGQERVARWTVLMYSVASIATLAAWPLGRFSSGQGWVDVAGDVLNLPLAYGLFGSLLMFLVTGSLLRRKRFGLWIVLILQVLGVLLALGLLIRTRGHVRMPALRGLELDTGAQITTYAGAVFGLLAIALLWWSRAPGPRWA